jgi:hypothetical protein
VGEPHRLPTGPCPAQGILCNSHCSLRSHPSAFLETWLCSVPGSLQHCLASCLLHRQMKILTPRAVVKIKQDQAHESKT